MQGSQRAQVVDGLDDFGGDEAALLELLAAVDTRWPMASISETLSMTLPRRWSSSSRLGECLGVGGKMAGVVALWPLARG